MRVGSEKNNTHDIFQHFIIVSKYNTYISFQIGSHEDVQISSFENSNNHVCSNVAS